MARFAHTLIGGAVLTDGVPLELTRVEGEEGRSGYVEAEAKILR